MSVISTARLLLSMLGILNGEANYHVFIFITFTILHGEVI